MSTFKTFSTTNRKLEQFFYVHRVYFVSQRKGADGLTEWTYIVDRKFENVLREYREIYCRDFA